MGLQGLVPEASDMVIVVYDLSDPDAWETANRHRNYWGKLYCDAVVLGEHHVLLVFRPSPDCRWRPWEDVRRAWIERELQGSEAA